MTGEAPEQRTILETEMIFGVKRRERIAYSIAGTGLLIGLLGIGTVFAMLPLKEVQAHLTIVDKDTGIAQRAVTVEKAILDHSEAVEQSLVYSYITDRETFDESDNATRVQGVYKRSGDGEQSKIKALWSDAKAPNYPPSVYGAGSKVTVKVTSITPIAESTVQVRFIKTLTKPDELTKEGKFYATISYVFAPETRNNLSLVWENPYGFYVTDYRVTAETLEN